MENAEPSDPELLAEWLDRHQEGAFRALVVRYAGLVNATALRTCGDESLATEIAQLTFITLAQKANALRSCASLGGWLHATARAHGRNLIRKSGREARKRQSFQNTVQHDLTSRSGDTWKRMRPVLDSALASLSEKDREALLLRFYRSLSIREIAATLGIATDAAQKRLDRATERLRQKLTRRGCDAGGSLSAVMLAGFATDTQHALSASALATKAIAAGSASSGLSSLLAKPLSSVLFKTTAFVPPVLALTGLLIWMGVQRQSISALETQNQALQENPSRHSIARVGASATGRKANTAAVSLSEGPIDWKKIAASPLTDPLLSELQQRLGAMSADELLHEIEKIDALNPENGVRIDLEALPLYPLCSKDPKTALTRFIDRFQENRGALVYPFSHAFLAWARKDPTNATTWFDQQNAAGRFDSKQLYDTGDLDTFRGGLIGGLLLTNPQEAAARLRAIPESQRLEFLERSSSLTNWIDEDNQVAYANMVRDVFPTEPLQWFGHPCWPIAMVASKLANDKSLQEVTGYLDRIDATTSERAACAEAAAESRVQMLSTEKINRGDLDTIRGWIASVAPDSVDTATGKALGRTGEVNMTLTFAEAAQFALDYRATTGNDDVLVGFLSSNAAIGNKEEARVLAASIADEARRKEILSHLR